MPLALLRHRSSLTRDWPRSSRLRPGRSRQVVEVVAARRLGMQPLPAAVGLSPGDTNATSVAGLLPPRCSRAALALLVVCHVLTLPGPPDRTGRCVRAGRPRQTAKKCRASHSRWRPRPLGTRLGCRLPRGCRQAHRRQDGPLGHVLDMDEGNAAEVAVLLAPDRQRVLVVATTSVLAHVHVIG